MTNELRYHLTARSSNRKTGPIAVTTTGRASCPSTCPLSRNGCYADGGPLAIHWSKVSDGERGTRLDAHCDALRATDAPAVRLNQAGDLPHVGGRLDGDACRKLASAASADGTRPAWTYTHHVPDGPNVRTLHAMRERGCVVNLSASSPAQADTYAAHGLPVTCLIPDADTRRTPAGRRIVPCPAQTHDVTCARCLLCARPQRKAVVGFIPHGSSVRKAREVLNNA